VRHVEEEIPDQIPDDITAVPPAEPAA